jgi:ATP-binding cassette, subfamily B, bacterial MsbA
MNPRPLLIRTAKSLFHFGIRKLTLAEKVGIKKAAWYLLRRPWALTIMLLAGLVAAVFESGTLALLGLAVSVITAGSAVGLPVFPEFAESALSYLFGEVSKGGVFLLLTGLAVIAQVLKGVLTYLSTYAQIRLAYFIQQSIQEEATNHIMSMNYGQVTGYPAGELASLVDQAGRLSDVVGEFGKAFRAIVLSLGYVVVMLLMSVMLTLAGLLVFALLWVGLTGIVRLIKRLAEKEVDAQIDTWRWTIEYLNAPRLLRIFGATNTAGQTINQARLKQISAMLRSDVIQAAVLPVFEIVTVIGAGAFLIVGYMFAGETANELVPKLFVFVLVFFRMKPQIKMLNDLRIGISKILPRLAKVGDFLQTVDKTFSQVDGMEFSGFNEAIEFRNVSFGYPKAQSAAVKNLNFSIKKGEMVALVGASGAGKSTMINLLIGLYQPTEGMITVDGVNLAELQPDAWRSRLGVVDQEVYLFNTSIWENISFGRAELTRDQIKEAARAAHAHEFIENCEAGYETQIGDRGFRLSGGQQQRIALARALARNPDILLLDEATSALDSVSERQIQSAINDLQGSQTVVVIAHRLSTVAKADKILVFDNGEIVESGTPKDLLHGDTRFSVLWKMQSGSDGIFN